MTVIKFMRQMKVKKARWLWDIHFMSPSKVGYDLDKIWREAFGMTWYDS